MQIRESAKLLEAQLNEHFEVNFKAPKIKVYADPQEFFNDYTGIKKKRSIADLIALSEEVSYYYNDSTKTVCFPGFKRNGEKSFKRVKHQTMKLSYLLHELIHHYQVESGGYSKYNLTDEGCCEITSYVISADIELWSDYWQYITVLWNLLDATTEDSDEKYELIRQYNIAPNKTKIANEWYRNFLTANPRLKLTPAQLVKQCEGKKEQMDKRLLEILSYWSDEDIQTELYRIHDSYKETLYSVFR